MGKEQDVGLVDVAIRAVIRDTRFFLGRGDQKPRACQRRWSPAPFVPVQPANFRQGWFGRGQVLVAAAGPASNFLQALGWLGAYAAVSHLVPWSRAEGSPVHLFGLFCRYSVVINVLLMAFNLIPIPPLDG